MNGENNVLTGAHVHTEGALWDSNASEGDCDCVRATLRGSVSAAVHAVAFILHHHLHSVLPALRIFDHGCHVSCTGTYSDDFLISMLILHKNTSVCRNILKSDFSSCVRLLLPAV